MLDLQFLLQDAVLRVAEDYAAEAEHLRRYHVIQAELFERAVSLFYLHGLISLISCHIQKNLQLILRDC